MGWALTALRPVVQYLTQSQQPCEMGTVLSLFFNEEPNTKYLSSLTKINPGRGIRGLEFGRKAGFSDLSLGVDTL